MVFNRINRSLMPGFIVWLPFVISSFNFHFKINQFEAITGQLNSVTSNDPVSVLRWHSFVLLYNQIHLVRQF